MAYSIQLIYKDIVQKLMALYPAGEARAIADRLVEFYCSFPPAKRVIAGDTLVNENTIRLVEEAMRKLLCNTPLQYVLGNAYFMDLELKVNPSVLIPRPETEELVNLIVTYQKGRQTDHIFNVLDVGTGSGCIAIAIKKYLPGSNVTAIDISEEALKVAVENAKSNQVEINFMQADILDESQWNKFPPFDLIVSNPPYVTNKEKKKMHRNVLDHEPHTALFVSNKDPLVFYRSIISLAKINLCKSGSLWFEINEMFGDEITDIALNQGFKEVNIIFDFRGKSRFLQCFKK